MVRANSGIAFNFDTILVVEVNYSLLCQVWMNFDLVDCWSDLAACENVVQHWDCAIANSNIFGKSFFYKFFHV